MRMGPLSCKAHLFSNKNLCWGSSRPVALALRVDAGLGQEHLSAFPSTGLSHSLAIVFKVFYCMDIFPFNSQKNL